jgi:3,4-dihydroxy 2-butanone 4-phosphate synthase
MAEVNGLPASASGINGHTSALSNPAPAHAAFDSIADVVEAFGA